MITSHKAVSAPEAFNLVVVVVTPVKGLFLRSILNVIPQRKARTMPISRRFTDIPYHRAVLAVDIENSTTQTNTAKLRQRRAMYDLFEKALNGAGITRRYRDPFIDRGDGILALIHPVDHVPKTLLLTEVLPALTTSLADQDFRLRAVVHAGEVHYDRDGCFGESLDLAFRLLDAPEFKASHRLAKSPLTLVVSEDIHRSVVRHGYPGIDPESFNPSVQVIIAGCHHRGWTLQTHGRTSPARRVHLSSGVKFP